MVKSARRAFLGRRAVDPLRGWIAAGAVFGVALGCAGCTAETSDAATRSQVEGREQRVATTGIGRAATAEEIAAWDIDVMPDGTGLPSGRGTVPAGREVFSAKCAACHGSEGTGGVGGPLVGRIPGDEFPFALDPSVPLTIGNFWPYATTLFDYTRRAMPFDAPGSLTDDEVYSLVAYLLFLNEIVSEDAVMNAQTLPAVVMPSRDRFVEDDRRGGREIR